MTNDRHLVMVVLMWEVGPMPEHAIARPVAPAVYMELEREGLIERQGGGWIITQKGRDMLTGAAWLL